MQPIMDIIPNIYSSRVAQEVLCFRASGGPIRSKILLPFVQIPFNENVKVTRKASCR